MVKIADPIKFDYETARIGELKVVDRESSSGRKVVDSILVNDEPLKTSSRFWTSLYARFGFNKSFFKYFSHEEVFARISDVETNKSVRLCIEHRPNRPSRLLAVSNPKKPVVKYDDLVGTLKQYQIENVSYLNGIVQSVHSPRIGSNDFQIGSDRFSNRFVMESPIDGYGQPNLYLSLLRQICSNGMVGYARTFRSSLSLGTGNDNPQFSITRALEGFGNDEGYAALRQRFESSAKSWASVYESNSIHKKLLGLIVCNQFKAGSPFNDSASLEHPVIAKFNEMTGDVSQIYGIANVDSLSAKRQRSLPVRCTVYDLLNFVSELSTHHLRNEGARTMQAVLGTLVSSEFDLEASIDSFGEFKDFFVSQRSNHGIIEPVETAK